MKPTPGGDSLAYLVRARVVAAGPRQWVVIVYALEARSSREIIWRVRIERTPTRARRAARELVEQVRGELGPERQVELELQGRELEGAAIADSLESSRDRRGRFY